MRLICILLIIILLITAFVFSSTNWYDHDEATHVYSLKTSDITNWFNPFQRVAFKILYIPFQDTSLFMLRFVNFLLLIAIVILISKTTNIMTGLIFLTFPFIQILGCRFYSEIPAMFMISLSLYCLYKNKLTWFALILSYAATVRVELILLFIPAIWLLRKDKINILALTIFPIIYYLASIVILNSWTELYIMYFKYSSHVGWKSPDVFHYSKALISMCGIWGLFIFANIFKKSRLNWFASMSLIIMLTFYTLTYWDKINFGPAIGIERHLLIIAPCVAILIPGIRFQKILIPVSIILVLLIGNLPANNEAKVIKKIVQKIPANARIYTEHTFVRYYLMNRTDNIKAIDNLQSGDLVIWDNHYAIRKISVKDVMNKECIQQQTLNGFTAGILVW